MAAPTKATSGVVDSLPISKITGLQAELDALQAEIDAAEVTLAGKVTATFAQGVWTPTITGITNVAATTSGVCHYTRLGNQVHCWGQILVDPTAAAPTQTVVDITLPVASVLATATDIFGVVNSFGATQVGAAIQSSADNTKARLSMRAVSDVNAAWIFEFDYVVN
jgi:hypothetical protein